MFFALIALIALVGGLVNLNSFRKSIKNRCKNKVDIKIQEDNINLISLQNDYYKENEIKEIQPAECVAGKR